ncbi:S41 family peptidase [Seonamhaeicola sp. ML3]|uniref:S41 family peptidase n=1 Tax=Seonamhaeicola sp. ML3 TaxID=2937786 RepID=UPI0020101F8F|nr:S41 family peptidase [Seonamhaeicola sp. ML3]
MQKLLLSIFLLVGLASCTSVKTYNEQITKLHTVEALHNDVDRLYNQLKKHHPKLYQYTSKAVLDFKFDSLKKSIHKPINSRTFYKKLAPVVTHVKQGHVSIGIGGKAFKRKELKALNKKKFEFYDLDFEYIEDKLLVTAVHSKDTSLVGNEIVKIDDEPVPDLIHTFKKRFTSDGYNTTLYNRYVGRRFSTFYYRDKGFVDSLTVTFKNKDSVYRRVLRRISKDDSKVSQPKDSINKIKPKKLSIQERKDAKSVAKKRRKDNKKYGFLSKRKQFTRNFSLIGSDSSVAYMKIRSFTNGNYKKFYKESFKTIDSLKTEYLILDLRDNGGGRIAEIDKLYSYLTNKEYRFILESEVNSRTPFFKYLMSNTTPNSLKIASGLASPIIFAHNMITTKKKEGKIYYKFGSSRTKKPNPLNFKGKIYVLINGNSFSASSLISTHLKATKRATFVGEETGGAYNGCVAGIYKIYQLPNSKVRVRMGLMQIEAPYKQSPDGYGVKPDIQVLPTIQNRLLKQDPELNWVLNEIGKL